MNSTLPLLNLLPNSSYTDSPSFGNSGLPRTYDPYATPGQDSDSGPAAQSALDFAAYQYTDDLGFSVHHTHPYPRSGASQTAGPGAGTYPHLVQPDFSAGFRSDHGPAVVIDDHQVAISAMNSGSTNDPSRYLDLDLSQPGPSTYHHTAVGLYTSGSEGSHEDSNQVFVDGVSHEEELVKMENGCDEDLEDGDIDNEEPLYVNAKQYHRILKRRLARARLEELNRLVRSRKPYLHESRHRHACSRPRGKGGRFLTADEIEALKREEAAKGAATANTGTSGSVEPSLSASPM